MSKNIIAIHTYGSNRVKSRLTGQIVSAYKQGYTSATSAVLLALYGNQAQDVSSKHATYHYIQINAETTVRHGHLLLKITDDELAQVEAITRQVHRPAVYRWMVDNANIGVFVWNGESPGTKAGYEYMHSRKKDAHLKVFV